MPDAWFRFDDRGFDHAPDGAPTGWRAFAYYPFVGAFLPTNGSMGDVAVRLPDPFRQDATGRWDQGVYEINLAIVEALVTRTDVPIEPTDERALGVDLDRDGVLGQALRVAFDGRPDGTTAMRYAGRAGGGARLAIAPGLFPEGTEFLHSVRYLDVDPSGAVAMAPRMKELRYARKARWLSHADLKTRAQSEVFEQQEAPDGAAHVLWEHDRGITNGQGWLFQGFIEAADGSLRPQSYEETVYCATSSPPPLLRKRSPKLAKALLSRLGFDWMPEAAAAARRDRARDRGDVGLRSELFELGCAGRGKQRRGRGMRHGW